MNFLKTARSLRMRQWRLHAAGFGITHVNDKDGERITKKLEYIFDRSIRFSRTIVRITGKAKKKTKSEFGPFRPLNRLIEPIRSKDGNRTRGISKISSRSRKMRSRLEFSARFQSGKFLAFRTNAADIREKESEQRSARSFLRKIRRN